jgi:hypothetical protein
MNGKSPTQRALNRLWGGVLERTDLDIAGQAMRLVVRVTENGITTRHTIVANGIADLAFHNSIPERWSYAEVTSLDLSKADDHVELSIVFWSDDCEMTIRAKRVRVDSVSRSQQGQLLRTVPMT